MRESYDEHRDRDDKSWGSLILLFWFFPSLRWLIPIIAVAVGGAWLINILGESTALNDSQIVYVEENPVTGELKTTKGCRAERLMPDGSCDKSITIDTVRKSFPFLGKAKNF